MTDHAFNPFSTRSTRPGALPFHFLEGEDAGRIVARLRQHNWFGQIVGPHGSGKSTLLATLQPALEAAGRKVQLVQLRQSEIWPRLFAVPLGKLVGRPSRPSLMTSVESSSVEMPPRAVPNRAAWRQLSAATQLIIDGYEQLGPLARWLVLRRCRKRGCGLLVTCHHDSGLPTIYSTQPRLELAQMLVQRLLPAADVIGPADVEAAWQVHGGNLRELLFSLYDLFEQRRSVKD